MVLPGTSKHDMIRGKQQSNIIEGYRSTEP
jgi:hypothetical protein